MDDDEEWDEQTLRDHGYEVVGDILESTALAGLRQALDAPGSGFKLPDMALAKATRDVDAQVVEALSPTRRDRRRRNHEAEFASGDEGAEIVDDLAQVAARIVVEFRGEYRYGGDYVAMACADLMENATTTAEAIALLLANGYVADAYARWRGLHELACQAVLMARASRPEEAAKRFLVHGNRLLQDDPAYGEPWATPEFYEAHSEWLRESYPNLSSKKHTPLLFNQRWIFDNAGLTSAAFDDWIKPSHDPVHMTSAAVALGSRQAGGAPAGYSLTASKLIGWRAACSLNEVVAHLCQLMVKAGVPLDRATAWAASFDSLVRERRPGPYLVED